MKKIKTFWEKALKELPTIWGVIWLFTITLGSVALLIQSFKWLLSVMGVI